MSLQTLITMKTRITTFVSCLLLSISMFGQTCIDKTLSVDAWTGSLELNAYDFLDGEDAADTYTISPSIFSCDDIGTVVTTITGPNGFTCTSTLTLVDSIPPVVIMEQGVIVTLIDGAATLTTDDVDNGSYDNCTPVTRSLSQTDFTCEDVGTQQIFMTVEDEHGNWNQTWSNVTVRESTPPTVSVFEYINVSFDQNGEANISFDMIEEGIGSFDNCTDITKSLSQSFFTCEDAGEQNVIYTAIDGSNNVTSKIITINLEDKLKPVPYVINLSTALLTTSANSPIPSVKLYAEDFDLGSYDNCGITNMTINKDVYTCEDIGENEVIFTVYDAAGNSDFAITTLTIIDNNTSVATLSCLDDISYSAFNDLPLTLTPSDVLAGGPYGCDFALSLELKDENDDLITNNTITNDYLGQVLTYTVYDWNTGNSCFGEIEISDAFSDCEFAGEESIMWPLTTINLDLLGVDASILTPDYIGNLPNYTYNDAFPAFILNDCNVIGTTYEDFVFTTNENIDKIIRTFTVFDWNNYDENTNEGVYTFVQLIKNINSPNSFICDSLPRSAPVGDCESGHTLEDDVEWPNGIVIADPRKAPIELINFSGIAPEDAEPNFFGDDASLYVAEYIDVVDDLTTESLYLERQWTVTRTDVPGIEWTYTQPLEVQIAQFANLVGISTIGNRGVPQVQLGNGVLTDQYGKAIVEDDFFISPQFATAMLNGLDLVDVFLAREHVLGAIQLSDHQVRAADMNEDGMLTTLDLVLLSRIIIGENPDDTDWNFIDVTDEYTGTDKIRGQYVAYKLGDVDDSALLSGQSETIIDEAELSFEDQLLNAGESYAIPFYSNSMINASGVQLQLSYDTDLIDILDVSSEIFGTAIDVNTNEAAGTITIVAYDVEESFLLDGSEALFEVSFTAKDNSILQKGLQFTDNYRSFIVDENLVKYKINGELENGIVLGTNDENFAAGINVYPNPTVDYINVDLSTTAITGDYNISLYNTEGRQVHTQFNDNVVNAYDLPTGSYILYLSSGENYYSQLVQIQK